MQTLAATVSVVSDPHVLPSLAATVSVVSDPHVLPSLAATVSAVSESYAPLSGVRLAVMSVLLGALPFIWRMTPLCKERNSADEAGFIEHLKELKLRLVRVLCWTLATFLLITGIEGVIAVTSDAECRGNLTCHALFIFKGAGILYSKLAAPLLGSLPESGALIAVGTASPLSVPMKAAVFAAVCIMMPFILSELWRFIAPGLYDNEKPLAWKLGVSSTVLFYLGLVFAYFFVFKLIFDVIAEVSRDIITWMPDINELFGFMLTIFFAFGLVFEIPVAVFILVRAGVVELEKVRKARPGVIIGSFVVAAIVTPPDVLSQLLLAIPCCLLFEVGLWVAAKWGVPKEEAEGESKPETSG